MQPLMSEQTFIIISCTSTYDVLLCVKFNKNNTLDGFEGLQGLWTGRGGGWDFRLYRFCFGKNRCEKLKKNLPPPSNNVCVVSRNGGGVNFS
jgi:hypothetical protein